MIDTTEAPDAEAVFAGIVSQLSDLQWNSEMTGPQAFGAMKQVLLLRNLVDHHATSLTGEVDRLGVADHKTTRLRELLISMGSSQHTDAIVRGLTHIDTRSPEPLGTMQHCEYLWKLLSHYFAGFTPAEIITYARQLGNELAAETPGGSPAAEDKTINSYTDHITDDGRLEISANLDIIAGEKTRTLMEALSAPTPQPDRSPNARADPRRCVRNHRGVGGTRLGRHHLLGQTDQRTVVDLVSGESSARRGVSEYGCHHRSDRQTVVV